MKAAAKLLASGAEFFSKRGTWIQDDFAETRKGESVEPGEPEAAKFCVMGYLQHQFHTNKVTLPTYYTAVKTLTDIVKEKGQKTDEYWQSIPDYNDEPNRKKKDIIKLFCEGAKRLCEEEKKA